MKHYTRSSLYVVGSFVAIGGLLAVTGLTMAARRNVIHVEVTQLQAAQQLKVQQEGRLQRMGSQDESAQSYRSKWEARRATYSDPGPAKQIVAKHARSLGVSIVRDTLPDQRATQREITYECVGSFEALLKWLAATERDIDYLTVSESAWLGRDDGSVTLLVTFKLPSF